MIIFSTGITHGGAFHADDVFATALLKIIEPSFTVKRVLSVPNDVKNCIVYDIGGGPYDHHTKNIRYHENGRRYASFGLLWKEYGEYVTGSYDSYRRIEENFVSIIDESDNLGEYNPISRTITAFNPTWNSTENIDDAFEEAVSFAKCILEKIIRHERSIDDADNEIKKALINMTDKIIILPQEVPFTETLINSEAIFAIYPSNRGGYCIRGIPVKYGTRVTKMSFPKAWRGETPETLQKLSGNADLVFCHNSGFIASTNTYESAILIAKQVIINSEIK